MNRNIGIDFFRIVAAFFVICIHAPFIIWGTNPIYKCAVPFFCLITGYYLKIDNDSTIFLKKITVHIKTLLVAVIVYSIFTLSEGQNIEMPNLLNLLLFNSFGFINAPHLWYLLALIISLSIIQLFNCCRLSKLVYLFAPLIIISPLGKYNIYPFSALISKFDANWMLTTMPYISLGLIIKKIYINIGGGNKRFISVCLIFSTVSLILSLVESKYFGEVLSEKSAFYLGTPLYTIGLFLFLLTLNIPHTPRIVSKADFCKKSSLQIYVWHFLLISILKRYSLYDSLQPFIAIYVFAFLVVILAITDKLKQM